jgi:DNA polymerase I
MIDNKLVIIDGNNLAYRAAHKFNLTDQRGTPTGVLFGFIYILRPLIVTLNPAQVITVFDGGRSLWRKEILPGYKLRDDSLGDSRDSFFDQINVLKKLLLWLNIDLCYDATVEADDQIYKLIRGRKDMNTVIVSSDKDFVPLIQGSIKVYSPSKDKLITYKNFEEVMGFESPEQFLDYLLIRGDKSDKIPGVPGMGEVRAKEFIEEFELVSNYLNNPTGKWRKYPIEEVYKRNRLLINLPTYYLKRGRKEPHTITEGYWNEDEFKKACRQYNIKKFLSEDFLKPFKAIK